MVVITDIRVPAEQFALGRLLDEFPDIDIELERIVPLREGVIPLFWVEGGEREAIEATIRDDPLTRNVEQLTRADDRILYEIVWSTEIDALVQPLIESSAEVLRGEGEVDTWNFQLQFETRDQLVTFRELCRENDVELELRRLYNPTISEFEEGELTDEQFDIIATAFERGYWDVPRRITLGELADSVDISSNAASQRMRRGLETLVGATIRAEE